MYREQILDHPANKYFSFTNEYKDTRWKLLKIV